MEIVNFYPCLLYTSDAADDLYQEFSLILSAMPIVMGKRMGISL